MVLKSAVVIPILTTCIQMKLLMCYQKKLPNNRPNRFLLITHAIPRITQLASLVRIHKISARKECSRHTHTHTASLSTNNSNNNKSGSSNWIFYNTIFVCATDARKVVRILLYRGRMDGGGRNYHARIHHLGTMAHKTVFSRYVRPAPADQM